MPKPEFVSVKLTKPYSVYNAEETITLPADRAERLIKMGVAKKAATAKKGE